MHFTIHNFSIYIEFQTPSAYVLFSYVDMRTGSLRHAALKLTYMLWWGGGVSLECLEEPALMTGSKPLLTKFAIQDRLESCESRSKTGVI